MPTRRQEKVARVVKRAVSDAISHDLADPRIGGLVSVTRVDMSPDLRNADVYLSIYGQNASAERRTFEAIQHARRPIQSHVAAEVQSKFCPVLRFRRDEGFKKTLDLMNLIDQAASEYRPAGEVNGEDGTDSDTQENPAGTSSPDEKQQREEL